MVGAVRGCVQDAVVAADTGSTKSERSRADAQAALGLGTAFSFNIWSEVKWFGKNIFELVDFLTAQIMLPVGGVLIALFAGWLMSRADSEAELAAEDPRHYQAWRILVRYVAPIGVGLVFLDAMGLLG